MDTNIFICQLPQETQDEIKHLLECYLHDEGFVGNQAQEIIENVMSDRLVLLENIIDLSELTTNL